ncbi:ABC transporter ATP-binding protein [Halocynthiibacter namhaensis]|uniref:ABC transporter ATP-binding protein n=1 Tax=Halocynthiibacter namhaensis TaxID=1290553 RepID=UPI0005795B20|nr:ABC transporter ATP-binding protein [Halocynthiibacter namhaensis]
MTDLVLELRNLRKTYNAGCVNEVEVLKGADLRLKRGEVVALIAPSGAGKSTLLHVAGLLDQASSGEVVLAGEALTGRSDNARTMARRGGIGFVYQFHHLLPEFTALENIILPQLANGTSERAAKARAEDLLERVGVSDRKGHRPAELSGGQQQRVAFCRAMANGPQLLLADEPTGNLDPETADQMFETLMEITRDTGMAALIATHNHELAGKMDRVVKLENGVLTEV